MPLAEGAGGSFELGGRDDGPCRFFAVVVFPAEWVLPTAQVSHSPGTTRLDESRIDPTSP